MLMSAPRRTRVQREDAEGGWEGGVDAVEAGATGFDEQVEMLAGLAVEDLLGGRGGLRGEEVALEGFEVGGRAGGALLGP